MPLTPAHLGPVVLIGSLGGKRFNLPVLIAAAVLIDFEVFYLGIQSDYGFVYHGFWHSYLGATIFGIIFGLILFVIIQIIFVINDRRYDTLEIYRKYKERRNHDFQWSLKCILFSSLFGVYTHIAMDWLLYEHIYSNAVFNANLYTAFTLSDFTTNAVYSFALITFVAGAIIYALRIHYYNFKSYYISSLYEIDLKIADIWIIFVLLLAPFTVAGTIILIIILSIFMSGLNSPFEVLADMGEVGPVIGISIICIILTNIFVIKSMKDGGWKFFE